MWYQWKLWLGVERIMSHVCIVTHQSLQVIEEHATLPDLSLHSSRPSDTYMRLYITPSLVQIMVCRLIGAKPLFESMLMVIWAPVEKKNSQWNLHQITKNVIEENAFEDVICKMADILYQPQCIKGWRLIHKAELSFSSVGARSGDQMWGLRIGLT